MKTLAIFGQIDGLGGGADYPCAGRFQIPRELQGRLSPVLHDDAVGALDVNDLQHILQRQWLEVEPIGGVVVGGHGLRIAVDHDGLVAELAHRQRRLHAAVVELDTLADAIRPAAEDQYLVPLRRLRLALLLIGGVHVGGGRFEFGGAGIDALENRAHAERVTMPAHVAFADTEQPRQALIGEAPALEPQQLVAIELAQAAAIEGLLLAHQLLDLGDEPRVDARVLVDLGHVHPQAQTIGEVAKPLRAGIAQLRHDLRARDVCAVAETIAIPGENDFIQTREIVFKAAQRFLQRFLEGTADGHGFTNGFHLRAQARLGLGEFFKIEPRHLGHDVVDGWLERCRRRAAGDLVVQLVEGVADRELGGHPRDGKAGRLGSQGRGARHPRVHLDDDHVPIRRVDGELHVGAAGVDADLAQYRDGSVAQQLVFLVGEGLRRRHGDGVARVHAHGVEVLDCTDDDAVVLAVAHHLHLEFLPAQHRFFQQHLVGRGRVQAPFAHLDELLAVVGDAAAAAAEGEGRPHDGGKSDVGLGRARRLEIVHQHRPRHVETDACHRFTELLAVLGLVYGFARRTDHLHAEGRQHALPIQIQGAIQCGLTAHGRQQGLRALFLDDLRQCPPPERLDIGGVRHLRVGHDGRWIGVRQHHTVPLFPQRLAGLRTGIVELAGLTDDNRPSTDDEHAFDVGALGHVYLSTKKGGTKKGTDLFFLRSTMFI